MVLCYQSAEHVVSKSYTPSSFNPVPNVLRDTIKIGSLKIYIDKKNSAIKMSLFRSSERNINCGLTPVANNEKGNKKLRSYIARYPVRRTTRSALHFTPWQTCSFQGHLNFSGKQLREDYSFTFPPLSVFPDTHLYS